jgi:hypothetical protein
MTLDKTTFGKQGLDLDGTEIVGFYAYDSLLIGSGLFCLARNVVHREIGPINVFVDAIAFTEKMNSQGLCRQLMS